MNNKPNLSLSISDLPKIGNMDDLSFNTHLSKGIIYKLSKESDHYYCTFSIPKKNGGKRLIAQPSKNLKALQSWILVSILNSRKVSTNCKGFEKKSCILNNASPHIGANAILNIDIDNFFPSIKANKIYNIFYTMGYNSLISTIFTNICTYKNSLPQGSPCSPKLSNLVCLKMDARIQGLVGKKGIVYTRYADDMSFSSQSPNKLMKWLPLIEKIINEEGYSINSSKTRLAGISRAKIVTGLLVNDEEIGIGKKKYNILRSKLHHLTFEQNKKNFTLLNHIKGWLSFLKSVDKEKYDKALKYIEHLKSKNPETLIAKL